MSYYIVEKVSLVDGKIQCDEVGYIDSLNKLTDFESTYPHHLDNWITENSGNIEAKTLYPTDFFSTNDSFYKCTMSTSTLDGRPGLSKITNINNIKG